MSEEFKKKVTAVREALGRVREGRVERTILKSEGARAYTETVPRISLNPPPGAEKKSA